MGLSKKELMSKYSISRSSLDKTLKALGIDNTKNFYSDEEVQDWIEPAREMIQDKKTLAQVGEWAAAKRAAAMVVPAEDKKLVDDASFAEGARALGKQVAQDFVDAMITPALMDELRNPLRSISRILGQMSSGEIRSLIETNDYRQDLARLMDRESPGRLVGGGNSPAPRLIEQGRDAEEDLEPEDDDPFKKYEDLPLDHEGQDG
jgi:hypothetical protein